VGREKKKERGEKGNGTKVMRRERRERKGKGGGKVN